MRAKKSLGQNFLRDESVIGQIVAALNLSENDTVVEIGPGLGALTRGLVETAGKVIAIEFDRDMVGHLNEQFGTHDHFDLIRADALSVDFAELLKHAGRDVKLVANLPYNISTPILQRLMDCRRLFASMVLMFQREVVERISAPAGGKERGFLSVLVENAFEVEYLFDVAPTAFTPVPKVWSAVIRLTPKETAFDGNGFRQVISAGFAQKRKTILNNLKGRFPDAAGLLASAGIEPMRRAETLTLDEWIGLTRQIRPA